MGEAEGIKATSEGISGNTMRVVKWRGRAGTHVRKTVWTASLGCRGAFAVSDGQKSSVTTHSSGYFGFCGAKQTRKKKEKEEEKEEEE